MRRGVCLVGIVAVAAALAGPASALAAGSISGTVTAAADGEPIADAEVCAESTGLTEGFGCTETGLDGTYVLASLPSGNYKVEFWAPFGANFVTEYYDGKATWSQADSVSVSDGVDTPEIDADLEEGGWLEGRAIDAATKAGIAEIRVCAFPVDEEGFGGCAYTEADGDYVIAGLAADSYEVSFFPGEESGGEYLAQYYKGKASWFEATPVFVNVGSGVAGIDAAMQKGGQIAGTVTDAASGAGVRFSIVCARDTLEGEIYGCVFTDGAGRYAIRGLPSGAYKVWFSPDVPEWEEEDDYFQQYYSGAPNFAQATPLTLVAPAVVSGIDARLLSRHPVPPTPPAVTVSPAPPVSVSRSSSAPRLHCGKGKRLLKLKRKTRCVRVHRKRHHGRHHARRDLFQQMIGEHPQLRAR